MKRYSFATGILLTVVLGFVLGPIAWAKPSDLPVENQIQCPECGEESNHGKITIGIDLLTGRVTVEVQAPKALPEVPMLDGTMPGVMAGCVDLLLRQLDELFLVGGQHEKAAAQPQGKSPAPGEEKIIAEGREKRAQQLFKMAEDCRLTGEYATACTCYRQVHSLAPTSRIGRLAIGRLAELEGKMREPAEESEPTRP